jgi:hypothetical protein
VVGLALEGDRLVVLAEQPLDVVAAASDLDAHPLGRRVHLDAEAGVLGGGAACADQVARLDAQPLLEEVHLGVPVGVEEHPPLLHAHRAVVLARREERARVVPLRGAAHRSRSGVPRRAVVR